MQKGKFYSCLQGDKYGSPVPPLPAPLLLGLLFAISE